MKKQTTHSQGQVRIIAGQWRGRKLPVINSEGLRPTTDRIKETLFNWLSPHLPHADCLDCFAGSGALGFEALSRYANFVTFVEKDRQVAGQLRNNLAHFAVNNGELIVQSTLEYLTQQANRRYDIIFIDPPFHQQLVQQTLMLLEEYGWLKSEAWIYLETESTLTTLLIPEHWQLHREKQAGQVNYRLYQRQLNV